jgi:sigma-B regulation protein RsbU (phosphoserine phosphatase)
MFSRAEWLGSAEMDALGRDMIAGRSGVRKLQNLEGVPSVWVVFTPVESVGWSLAAAFPEHQLMAPVNDRINRQAALLLCGLVGALAILMAIAFWFTRPIERLAAAAAKVAGGDLDARVEGVSSRDEIGRFADTFNRMTVDLKQSVESRLREEAARKSIEAELHVARQIQNSLLPMTRPAFPHRDEFALDAINEPAVIMAGDFFDFWLVDEDTLALVMADVSGKGVPAAMFMAVARTILRNASEPGRGPAELLRQINDVIVSQNETEMFVTVVYAHYRISTGAIRFANGGHCLPMIVRASGSVEILGPTTGPLVGVLPDIDFDEALAALSPGDTILLYTDGVTEAADATGRMLGESGLTDILRRHRITSPEDMCLTVLEEVNRHRSSPNQDDVTLLALKRNH